MPGPYCAGAPTPEGNSAVTTPPQLGQTLRCARCSVTCILMDRKSKTWRFSSAATGCLLKSPPHSGQTSRADPKRPASDHSIRREKQASQPDRCLSGEKAARHPSHSQGPPVSMTSQTNRLGSPGQKNSPDRRGKPGVVRMVRVDPTPPPIFYCGAIHPSPSRVRHEPKKEDGNH